MNSPEVSMEREAPWLGTNAQENQTAIVATPYAASPKLSVIIATYNNAKILDQCIASWQTFAGDQDVELIVIADGCKDNTIETIERWQQTPWGKKHLRYCVENNVHELLCTNRGMAEARGELILSWHDDMFLRSYFFIPELLKTFDRYSEIGLIGLCRGLLCHSSSMPKTWEELTEPNRLESTIGPRFSNWFKIYEIDAVMRPWITRRACIEKVGPLDCEYKLSEWDEADLCYRIREGGWKCATHAFERLGAYVHLGSSTISKTSNDSYKQQVLKNGQLFYSRWAASIDKSRSRQRTAWARRLTLKSIAFTTSRAIANTLSSIGRRVVKR